MAKNRKYKIVYEVTIEGVTTNGAYAEFAHGALTGMVKTIGQMQNQTSTSWKVKSSEGDFDAKKGELKND